MCYKYYSRKGKGKSRMGMKYDGWVSDGKWMEARAALWKRAAKKYWQGWRICGKAQDVLLKLRWDAEIERDDYREALRVVTRGLGRRMQKLVDSEWKTAGMYAAEIGKVDKLKSEVKRLRAELAERDEARDWARRMKAEWGGAKDAYETLGEWYLTTSDERDDYRATLRAVVKGLAARCREMERDVFTLKSIVSGEVEHRNNVQASLEAEVKRLRAELAKSQNQTCAAGDKFVIENAKNIKLEREIKRLRAELAERDEKRCATCRHWHDKHPVYNWRKCRYHGDFKTDIQFCSEWQAKGE